MEEEALEQLGKVFFTPTDASAETKSGGFVSDEKHEGQWDRLILKISEEEKQKLGRDLHDDLGQQLTCVDLLVHSIQRQLDQTGQMDRSKLDRLSKLVRNALVTSKNMACGLSTFGLEEQGVCVALNHWISSLDEVLPIKLTFRGPEPLKWCDRDASVHIYRIVQEAVQNAIKHAGASKIQVALMDAGAEWVLTVEDNGNFSDEISSNAGLGVKTMLYRSRLLHAPLHIQKNQQGGLTVRCEIPSNVLSNNVDKD